MFRLFLMFFLFSKVALGNLHESKVESVEFEESDEGEPISFVNQRKKGRAFAIGSGVVLLASAAWASTPGYSLDWPGSVLLLSVNTLFSGLAFCWNLAIEKDDIRKLVEQQRAEMLGS